MTPLNDCWSWTTEITPPTEEKIGMVWFLILAILAFVFGYSSGYILEILLSLN